MFNPEKLLGGLIRSSTRGSRAGLGGLISGGAALGVLGVAMEAVEHYMNKPPSSTPPPSVPGGASAPPPPIRHAGAPPPPPPRPGGTGAVPPPPPAASPSSQGATAVLLIRAMIAAANADGVIDQSERDAILERLESVALSAEEHAFLVKELLSPVDLDTIVAEVTTPQLAEQVYTVSLLAIEVDTEQEHRYLVTLANRLGVDPQTRDRIHRDVEY